eukprot:GHVU01054301.1.p2 GENE.GHVU01054301.1~~GHVU01054301.1.p2  ORF type:complete len:152 (+),score=18.10 GHVU01054301.1:651-1106(+)
MITLLWVSEPNDDKYVPSMAHPAGGAGETGTSRGGKFVKSLADTLMNLNEADLMSWKQSLMRRDLLIRTLRWTFGLPFDYHDVALGDVTAYAQRLRDSYWKNPVAVASVGLDSVAPLKHVPELLKSPLLPPGGKERLSVKQTHVNFGGASQ